MKHLHTRFIGLMTIFILFFSLKSLAQPSTGTLFIVGAATPGGWSNPIPPVDSALQQFTKISNTEYKLTITLIGGNEYKFIAKNGSWTENWGIAITDDPTEVNGGPFTFNSNNIKAPALTGTYVIDVNFSTNIFTVKLFSVPKVAIASFTPTSAATGDTVTIKGSGFTGTTAVSFGATNASSFTVVNDTLLTAIVGKGASGTIQIVSPNGTGILGGFTYKSNTLFIVGLATHGGWNNPINAADSAAQQFTLIAPNEYKITIPLIGGKEYKFIPENGSWAVSYGIVINDDPKMINSGTLVSSNSNNILSPAASGTYIIVVNLATNTFTVTLSTVSTINIASFNPTNASKDSTVTIKGYGFTGATWVSFGDTAAASFVVLNDSTITAVVGSGASGSVKVSSPNGTISLTGFTFNAPVAKQTAFIIGTAVAGGWNNPIPSADSVAQQFVQVGTNELKLTTHLIGGGEYKFFSQDGSWANNYGIAILDDPKSIYGGTLVSDGKNILAPSLTGTYTIDINTKSLTFTVTLVSPDTLFIIGSATANGWNNPLLSIDSAAQQFAQVSATEFKITTHLTSGTQSLKSEYKFIARNGSWVYNWGIAKVDDSSEVYGGPIVYDAQNIMAPPANGIYTIDVNFATNTFSVTPVSLDKVVVSSFNPLSGSSDSTITIKGIGFTGATSVSFGGTPALSFIVLSDTTITAIIGAGTSGSVQVVSPDGTASLSGFTYIKLVTQTGYIVGSAVAGGWSNPIPTADSVAQKFVQVGANELKLTTHLVGGAEYKFIPTNGTWANSYGIAIQDDPSMVYGGKLVPNGKNILAPSLSGTYIIDINVLTQTFTVSLVSPDTLFIVGNATANGWNNPLLSADSAAQQFIQVSPTEFTLNIALIADSSYKFIARNGNWNYNWGIAINNDTTMVNSGTLLYGVNSKDILAPSVSGNYVINVNFAKGTFTVTSTLPVSLSSFAGKLNNKGVGLNWSSSTEINLLSYEVEKYIGGTWKKVGNVNALNKLTGANYNFIDQSVISSNVYRLKTIEKAGISTFSKTIVVNAPVATSLMSIYPTVVHDGNVFIRMNQTKEGKATVSVFSLNGKMIQRNTITTSNGTTILTYTLNGVTNGTYIINIETVNDKKAFKIIVE